MYSKFLKVDKDRSVGVYEVPGDTFVVVGITEKDEEFREVKIVFSKEAMFMLEAIMIDWIKKVK